MLALYRAGRQSHALEVYQRHPRYSPKSSDLEPGPRSEPSKPRSSGTTHTRRGRSRTTASRCPREDPAGRLAGRVAAAADDDDDRPSARGRVRVCALGGGDARLVTLTGPGGSARRDWRSPWRTRRIAFPEARPVESSLSDFARWVELAAVARSETSLRRSCARSGSRPEGGRPPPKHCATIGYQAAAAGPRQL